MHEKQRLMLQIQKYDFLLYDLQLYLDTHPNCPQGLALWEQYQALRKRAVAAYVQKYGPIRPDQTQGNAPWRWNQGPWPWEKEAN